MMHDRRLSTIFSSRNWGALRIAGLYLVIGCLYILFSDRLAAALISSPEALTTLSIYKGLGFVMITALIFFALIHREMSALQASEAKYRLLAENMADVVWILDAGAMRFSYISPSIERLSGYSVEEALAQPFEEMLAPNSLAQIRQELQQRMRGFLAGDPGAVSQTREVEIIRKDGSTVWAEVASALVKDHKNRVRVIGVSREITARKLAEEALQASADRDRVRAAEIAAIMDAVPAYIWIARDPRCLFLEGNRATYELVQARPGSNLSLTGPEKEHPLNYRVMRDGQDIPPSELPVQVAASQGIRVRDSEFDIVLEDGSIGHLLGNAEPLFHANGEPAGAVAAFSDITTRKHVEDALREREAELRKSGEALRQTVEELARSNTELEQFAYVASHDLQEPLRAIRGMVQLLQQNHQGRLDTLADEYILHIVEAASRMQNLINDLLAFSQVNRKSRPFEAVDMSLAVQAALDNLVVAMHESGAVLTQDELPVVFGDFSQLTQVFQNLISNAIKFRGEQPPQIHLGAERMPDEWRFCIRDNGIGIEEQYFERIFAIFQRLHTRHEYAGTGIGLAICRKIIERHEGHIWVESRPGQGATFYFTLPHRRRTDANGSIS